MTRNKHLGTSFKEFLREDGVEESVDAAARERVHLYRSAERLHELAEKGREWLDSASDEQLKSFKE